MDLAFSCRETPYVKDDLYEWRLVLNLREEYQIVKKQFSEVSLNKQKATQLIISPCFQR